MPRPPENSPEAVGNPCWRKLVLVSPIVSPLQISTLFEVNGAAFAAQMLPATPRSADASSRRFIGPSLFTRPPTECVDQPDTSSARTVPEGKVNWLTRV